MMGTIGPTQNYGMMSSLRLRRQQPQALGEMAMQEGSKPGQASSMQFVPQAGAAPSPFANYQLGQSASHGLMAQVGSYDQDMRAQQAALKRRRFAQGMAMNRTPGRGY